MKKALVVGGGRGQIPVINLCHKYGWYVTVVSPKGNYPGISIADDVLFEDVKNKESILEFAKVNDIKAVLSDQLDVAVPTVAYVAEQLGLKGITYDVSLRFTNKYIMRKSAKDAGINVPDNAYAVNIDEAVKAAKELGFPLMIKPVDSAASRGVYKISNIKELEEKFYISQKYSKSNAVIIEQFITGKEYVVDAFTHDFQVNNLIVGHRDYFDVENTFIPSATVFLDANSANSSIENKLKEINKTLVSSFKLPFGITHAEYLYDEKEDKIYLVEIAARGGGVFISSDLIPDACGVNANDLYVKEVLGIPYNDEINLTPGASAYFCYLTPEGVVCELNNLEQVEKIEGVCKAFFDNIELGMHTCSICDKSSRKGPIIVCGKSKDDCYKTISIVKETLSIKIKTVAGIEDIIWE